MFLRKSPSKTLKWLWVILCLCFNKKKKKRMLRLVLKYILYCDAYVYIAIYGLIGELWHEYDFQWFRVSIKKKNNNKTFNTYIR